ncbi:lithostathine-1-alpha, partial [Eurytemora carolleeae]|uniref:lithostathine-1-alpha n=1 Tax=Eurytemora carolleeae TaxID=1294199 RepID=UPI000C78285B
MFRIYLVFLILQYSLGVEARFAKASQFKTQADACPLAFQQIAGRCYFFGYFKLNWFRAAEFCHNFGFGSSLATVETKIENDKIEEFLLEHGDKNTGVWLGGSENGHTGQWAWFPTGELVEWVNWGMGQPTGLDQHCMYIVGGQHGYQWADFHCGFQMQFLCEYKNQKYPEWKIKNLSSEKNPMSTKKNISKISRPIINQESTVNSATFSSPTSSPDKTEASDVKVRMGAAETFKVLAQDEKSVVLNKPETEPDLIQTHLQSSKNFQKIQKEMKTRIDNQIQKAETKKKNVTIINKDISIL